MPQPDPAASAAHTCQWKGCKARALPKPAAKGTVNGTEVDLYLCGRHVVALERGSLAHVSVSVEPTPARPA